MIRFGNLRHDNTSQTRTLTPLIISPDSVLLLSPRAPCKPPLSNQPCCDLRFKITVGVSCKQETPRMASTSPNLPTSEGTPAGVNSASSARGGRGRGRGRGRGFHASGSEHRPEHTGGRNRGRAGIVAGRGGGRAEQDSGSIREARSSEKGKAPVSSALAGSAVLSSGADAAADAAADADVDADEGEVCFICASPVQHTAVAPCNHRSCHICSLRLRALYKTKACAHCRTESDHVIFTDDANKNFQAFAPADFFKSDDNLGIRFENLETYDDTRLLLQYNCPDSDCDVACLGWPDLHRHVKTAHGKVMW